jgi:response regulator RpfG family c-di-GMP phosphodiesterase
MPHMNGFELFQEIKNKDRYAKACFFTASEVYYESLRKEFSKLSSCCFIRKPIPIDCLVNKITKALIEFKFAKEKSL